MIQGHDILVLSDDWHGLPNSTKHLFRHMLAGNRVFWWNIISRLPRPTWRDAQKVAGVLRKSLLGAARGGAETTIAGQERAPYCATPLIVPWFSPSLRRLNRRILERKFRQVSRQIGIRSPIVLTTLPCTVDFVRGLDATAKVYYCVDEWLDYPGLNPKHWQIMEEALLDSTDGFVATSTDLYRKRRPQCPSLYLPHGVDYEHFADPAQKYQQVAVLERMQRPIVGFFGLVAEWIDLEAIRALSRAFPRYSFVLLGKVVTSIAALKDRPNVHCLGPVPYDDLPRYAHYFDVGLIPFVKSRLTHAVNPLKLMEYFALGVPVVATRLSQLEEMDGPIWLAGDEEEYRRAIESALQGRIAARTAAQEIASHNTWRQRAEVLSIFMEHLEERSTPAAPSAQRNQDTVQSALHR